jgi:hypothetical protein
MVKPWYILFSLIAHLFFLFLFMSVPSVPTTICADDSVSQISCDIILYFFEKLNLVYIEHKLVKDVLMERKCLIVRNIANIVKKIKIDIFEINN